MDAKCVGGVAGPLLLRGEARKEPVGAPGAAEIRPCRQGMIVNLLAVLHGPAGVGFAVQRLGYLRRAPTSP